MADRGIKGIESREFVVEGRLYNQFTKSSDSEIWQSFTRGDESAFAHIYGLQVNALFNFGRQFTDDSELVKDVIQDLFVRLRSNTGSKKIISIKSYLFKCLYRDLIKRIEKERLFVGEVDGDFGISFSREHNLIEEQIDELRKRALIDSLNKLTVKQRQALLLFYYEGFTYAEVADIFEMEKTKSARKLVYRSIDKLKTLLRPKLLILLIILYQMRDFLAI